MAMVLENFYQIYYRAIKKEITLLKNKNKKFLKKLMAIFSPF